MAKSYYPDPWKKKTAKGYKTLGKMFSSALGLGTFIAADKLTSTSKSSTCSSNKPMGTRISNTYTKSCDSTSDIYSEPIDLKNLDDMFEEVARYVVSQQEGSTSRIQRYFELGPIRAEKITDQLEAAGILGSIGLRGRCVLIQGMDELERVLKELKSLRS